MLKSELRVPVQNLNCSDFERSLYIYQFYQKGFMMSLKQNAFFANLVFILVVRTVNFLSRAVILEA